MPGQPVDRHHWPFLERAADFIRQFVATMLLHRTAYCFILKHRPWNGLERDVRSLKVVAALLMSSLSPLVLPAQQGSYSFLHFTSEQGLSNDHVTGVLKDRQGFLWVSTVHGLNRFDGLTFRQFFKEPDNPNSLRDNFVQFMTLAPDGSIWLSGRAGICRLDPAQLQFEPVVLPENADSLENDEVGRVVFDEKGMAWVSTVSGIYCLDPATRQQIGFWETPPHIGDFYTYLDKNGQLWLLNEAKLFRFDTNSKKRHPYTHSQSGVPMEKIAIIRLEEDLEGKLWLASWFNGLLQYDPVQDAIVDFPDQATLSTGILADKTFDGKPFFWVGGGDHGVYLFYPAENRTREFPPNPRDPYSHNNYLASFFYKDEKTGEVWIGTEAGLELYAPAALRFGRATIPVVEKSGQFSLVSSVVKDKTDPTGRTYYLGLWINGIFKWDRLTNTIRQLSKKELPLLNDGIFSMHQDRQGYIWVTTFLGVTRFHPVTGKVRKWTEFFTDTKDRVNSVLCMLEDPAGQLWFGSNAEGLFRYNPGNDRIEPVPLPDSVFISPGKKYISALSADTLGRIWMSTNLGPVCFDPVSGKLKVIRDRGKIAVPAWAGIIASKRGPIYAVTVGALMEIDYDGNILRKFEMGSEGLLGQPAFLVEDKQGKIWLNSNHYLHCLDPATGKFSHYGIADGLFSNAPTDALNIMPDGEVFIGFQNAFNYFDPVLLRKNPMPPPVAITSIRVMNKERKPVFMEVKRLFNLQKPYQDALLVLRPGETLFTVEFSALNFNQPERNRYAYILEDFDQDWNYTDRPVATYTNLDGGEYLLRLKAANNDGVWNETGALLRVRVIPPLVKRWYFRLFLLLLLGGLLFGIWWYRRSQRRRLDAFRESLARDLHDEMGSTLSSIRFFSEFALQQTSGDKPQVASVLQRISESASALSESMQDIVWAMKRKTDQLEDLSARMTEFGLRILEARNVRFTVQVNEGFSGKQLAPEQRRNVYLIFKEAVNNAAKYAGATEVKLFLALKKGLLLMKISDDGKGFTLLANNGGNGLQNMRNRAEEIGGKLEIFSAPGEGTRVELWVRV